MQAPSTKQILSTSLLAMLCIAATAAPIVIPTVTIGDPGNLADTSGVVCGAVSYTYAIGKYEVSNAEYTAFLNAVDPSGTNPNTIYKNSMGSDTVLGGISFTSTASIGSKYAAKTGFENKPVVYVTFFDAMRFANWVNNGQGGASTETGAYNLSAGGLAGREFGATVFVASEDEWYKAAYYDPTKGGNNYWYYPTRSGADPTAATPNGSANQANYKFAMGPTGGLTDGGAYTGSASHYGTYDQGGNVWEWNDSVFFGSSRGLRGGSWGSVLGNLQSSGQNMRGPGNGTNDIGFRIVISTVPEPTVSVSLMLAGGLLLSRRKRPSAL